MAFDLSKNLAAGTKVRVSSPTDVPEWCTWDDDHGRTSGNVKKRLQMLFFRGDKKINAEVVYIAKESERENLRRKGRVKVRVREPSGSCLVITADPTKLMPAR